MESYVTRNEFEKVSKELRRLHNFLLETFGNKFADYGQENGKEGDSTQSLSSAFGVNRVNISKSNDTGVPQAKKSYPVSSSFNDSVLVGRDPLKIGEDEVASVPIPVLDGPIPPRLYLDKKLISPATETGSNDGESLPSTKNQPVFRVRIVPPTVAEQQRFASTSNNSMDSLRSSPPLVQLPTPATATSSSSEAVSKKRKRSTDNPTQQNKKSGTVTLPLDPRTVTTNTSQTTSFDITTIPPPSTKATTTENISSTVIDKPPKHLPSFKKRSLKLDRSQDSSSKKLAAAYSQQSQSQASTSTATASPPPSSSSETEIIQCDLCHLFIYSSQMEEHMKNHARLDDKSTTSDWNDNPIFKRTTTCPLCKVTCPNFTEYEKHCMQSHRTGSGMPCPKCGKCFNLFVRLKRHMFIHKKERFTCDLCGKCYNRKDNLNAHVKTHDNKEPTIFYCGFCKSAAFSSRDGRDRHMAEIHSKEIEMELELQALSSPKKNTRASTKQHKSNNNPLLVYPAETITCGNGTDNLLKFEYEGDDDDDDDEHEANEEEDVEIVIQ